MELPNCLDCKYSDQGFPCHTAAGTYDFAKVARAVMLHGRTFSVSGDNLDADSRDEYAWASDCAYEVEEDYPHLLLPLTIAAIDACETTRDAAYVAAGLLENAVCKHGPVVVDHIERLACASAKFRYVLSAIWGRAHTDPEVWARVCTAVGHEGLMDTDGRGPSNGMPVVALSDKEAEAVLKERVWLTATKLGLV